MDELLVSDLAEWSTADEFRESSMTRPSAKNAKPLAEAMREVVRVLRSENYSTKTIEGYREKLRPFFAFLDDRQEGDPTVGDFTLDNARDYMVYRLDPKDERRPLSAVSGRTSQGRAIHMMSDVC